MDWEQIIVTAIVGLAGAIFAAISAWVMKVVVPWINSHTSANQQDTLYKLVKVIVQSAEQTMQSASGADRFAYVKQRMEESGYKLDTSLLKDLIESAVLEMTISLAWGLAQSDTVGAATLVETATEEPPRFGELPETYLERGE